MSSGPPLTGRAGQVMGRMERGARFVAYRHLSTCPNGAESVLQIGDRALEKSHYGNASDLGQEWFELTGMPFVFACWMSQTPITQELLTQLHNAKMTGKQSLEQIANRQQILAEEEALSYLTKNIQYDIDGPELVGMKTFFEWVEELENQNYDTSLRFVA